MNEQSKNQEIFCKRPYCLINDKGVYFEEYTKDITNVLKHPTYNYILEHLQEIKTGDKIIFLHTTQKKEIELLGSYLPTFTISTHMHRIISIFIPNCYEYDEEQILKLAESSDNRYTWLSLFVFARIHKKYNLNPSILLTTKPTHHIWEAYNIQQISEPKAKKYIASTHNVNAKIFLELITADILGEETKESKALEQFLQLNNQEEFSAEEIGMPHNLIEVLFREGELYKPSENTLRRLR
jgi:hypothetical protein